MDNESVDWNKFFCIASRSDVGMRRSSNQDNLSVLLASSLEQWQRHGHLLLVADGMGAHAAGELASQLAAENLSHLYVLNSDRPTGQALRESIEQTNYEIHRRGQANPDFFNMGTTCSSIVLAEDGVYVGHVGDSRVYRLRGNRLTQLTFDHSLVWEMRAAGQFKDAPESEASVPKNVITRSLGPYPEVKVDIEGPFPMEKGDTFLLCSDGLTGPVSDEEIGSFMGALQPQEAVEALVDLANLRGGPDNITVVVAKVLGLPDTSGLQITKPRRTKEPNILTPVLWGVGLVLAIVCFAMRYFDGAWTSAILPGVGAGLVLVSALVSTIRDWTTGDKNQANQKHGKAPYTQLVCSFGKPIVETMSGVVDDLIESGKKANWEPDWKPIKSKLASAQQAAKEGRLHEAVGDYGRVISGMMKQLRRS